MKNLLVDFSLDGHHVPYISAITSGIDGEMVLLLPEIPESTVIVDGSKHKMEAIISQRYFPLLKQIEQVAIKHNIDLIHVVYADSLLRYFGLGLKSLRKWQLIMTFHHFRYSFLRNLARKMIFRQIDVGIVHTRGLYDYSKKHRIKNVVQIEYPCFEQLLHIDQQEARRTLGIQSTKPVLVALGGTRLDKGLDLLLQALINVRSDFFLLVAGAEQDFKKEYIEKAAERYKENVKLLLKFLSKDEMALSINASDIIVLPYRKCFDGASGPLVEGVALNKVIIGPNHGSLGMIIEDNHLGYTFEAENVESLAEAIDGALVSDFQRDAIYMKYQEEINPNVFVEKHQTLYSGLEKKLYR